MTKRHVNPEGMLQSPYFSQAVVVENPAKTIYVGGQNGVDAEGELVGPGLREQSLQAYRNIARILEAEGATLADIVHWRIAAVEGSDIQEGLAAFGEVWNQGDPPPAITVHFVSALGGPGFLVEIDAVAAV
jgi:enamine deaminase RidA (YjgF/YER057c/UK114 family)